MILKKEVKDHFLSAENKDRVAMKEFVDSCLDIASQNKLKESI